MRLSELPRFAGPFSCGYHVVSFGVSRWEPSCGLARARAAFAGFFSAFPIRSLGQFRIARAASRRHRWSRISRPLNQTSF